MEDEQGLPDIFYTLLEQKEKAHKLTPEILAQYYELTRNSPTFFHEFFDFLGAEKTIEFIQIYGGVALNVPSPADILSAVRKSTNEQE